MTRERETRIGCVGGDHHPSVLPSVTAYGVVYLFGQHQVAEPDLIKKTPRTKSGGVCTVAELMRRDYTTPLISAAPDNVSH